MEAVETEVIQLELKYCERCGGLWLRVKDTDQVYCAACVAAVSELPARRTKSRPRLPVNHKIERREERFDLAALCGQGGNA